MKNIFLFLVLCFFCFSALIAQIPNPALVGYWHNWNDVNAPYIQLDLIDSRYNVVEIAFAVPTSPSDMNMLFVPDGISQSSFITKVQSLQSQGKKVLLSIGGANTSIDLTTILNKSAFVNSITNLLNTYGFDGMDLDIENGNSILASGTIAQPTSAASINLIDAVKQVMLNYRTSHSKKLLLTLAPETAYVLGGQSAYGGIWGGYLPILNDLRDSIDLVQVQLYNSGSMYGIDGNVYTQGSADFIVAMTEAVIHGFTTGGGAFAGFPASKIAVGLPACANAAGGGFADTSTVQSAIMYLMGNGPKPGLYTLSQNGAYPTLGGMMTWSINWDAVNTCGSSYSFASNFNGLFNYTTNIAIHSDQDSEIRVNPNPASDLINVCVVSKVKNEKPLLIYDSMGNELMKYALSNENNAISLTQLKAGIYLILYNNSSIKFVKY